ncbi:MAG TPA: long-chain fatty acid--CoA ligase [Gemmatimonadales bacterium]|nr:long-chain fatty acid--CoA ligase [Gemmatimonadales bacterium]
METLADLFAHIVASNPPDREILRIRAGRDWRGYTTARFEEAVRETAGRLTHAGVRAGDRVGLFCENRPEWHAVDFACHLLGAVLVPLYPSIPAATVGYVVRDAGAKVLLVSGRERADLARTALGGTPGVRLIGVDPGLGLDHLNDLPVDAPPPVQPKPDDLASLIYTSGTTGDPKGVMLTHRNFVVQLVALQPLYPITERDEVMSFLPLAHVFQRILDYLFLYCRCRITYVEAVEKAGPMLPLVRPTIMASVPRVYERAYVQIMGRVQKNPRLRRLFTWATRAGRRVKEAHWQGRRAPLGARLHYLAAKRLVFRKVLERFGGRLRFTVSGGAPLAREIAEFFDIVGLPLLNGYGLTESAPVIAVNRLETNRLGSVGPVAPFVEVRIAPDGEILARGPNIMKGYWKKPEATAEVLDRDGWLHTGDIGHLDADGFLFITDRKKDILVTAGGKNVAPQPIEAQLATSPYIAHAVAVGDSYPYVTALITPNFEALEAHFKEQGINGKDRAEMAAHPVTEALVAQTVKEVNARLASYERIRRFTVLPVEFSQESGEITPSLKVKRKVVAQRYRPQIEEMYLKTHRTQDYGLDA